MLGTNQSDGDIVVNKANNNPGTYTRIIPPFVHWLWELQVVCFTYPLRAGAGPYSPLYPKGLAKFLPYRRFPIVFVVGMNVFCIFQEA